MALSDIENSINYWITPVRSGKDTTSNDIIKTLVGREKVYALSDRALWRKHLKSGDWICFYSSQKGVVAHAKIVSSPEQKLDSPVAYLKGYPWLFHLDSPQLYQDHPVVLDEQMRRNLDALKKKDQKHWAWFVQSTRKISEHDFDLLTRR
ncbi:MAG: hypothetical protein ABSE80_02190 [Halobacteriota archaeon]